MAAGTPLSSAAKVARATIIPAKIAIPPNLGIGLLCTRLSSLGTSIAPILGAIQMAKGVAMHATAKASRNGAHNIKLVAVTMLLLTLRFSIRLPAKYLLTFHQDSLPLLRFF